MANGTTNAGATTPPVKQHWANELMGWVNARFPLTALWESQLGQVLRAEELQLLVLLRLARAAGARAADRHRHLPHHELQARRGARVRLGRVHHARGAVGLADPLHALDRRLGVLHRRVPAHVPRAAVRLVPQAARAHLDLRLPDLPLPDGRGVLRLSPSLGSDVVLGRAGDREPVRRASRSSGRTSRSGSAATTWSATRRSTASSPSTSSRSRWCCSAWSPRT